MFPSNVPGVQIIAKHQEQALDICGEVRFLLLINLGDTFFLIFALPDNQMNVFSIDNVFMFTRESVSVLNVVLSDASFNLLPCQSPELEINYFTASW